MRAEIAKNNVGFGENSMCVIAVTSASPKAVVTEAIRLHWYY